MKSCAFALALMMASFFVLNASSAESPKKSAEEKLQDEIQRKLLGKEEGWQPKMGKFVFSAEDAEDGKPIPKVVGTLQDESGALFQVMVFELPTIEVLKGLNNKQVNLMGKLVNLGGKGPAWLTNGPVAGTGGAPATRHKRGGL